MKKTHNILVPALLSGMVFGCLYGCWFSRQAVSVAFLGTLFLNALKMIIVPLVVSSMITGITKLGDIRKIGPTGLKTLAYYLVTTGIAVITGIILVNIIQPGVGVNLADISHDGSSPIEASFSITDLILSIVPDNLFRAMLDMKILPLIFFSLLFGAVLTMIGKKGEIVISFFEGINEAVMRIVHIIMWFAPIGIFGLVAGKFAEAGGGQAFMGELTKLGKYFITVITGLSIHSIIVLPLILFLCTGKNPKKYFTNMLSALTTAFSTGSSAATLPVTMECLEEKNKVSPLATNFVAPLGATINMDGTSLYEAVAAIFIAQLYGIDLSFYEQSLIFITATLAGIGAAAIPQAGLVTMVMVLQTVNLPLEGISMILAIDWFLDRCRTTVNVWGDSIGAAVIANTKEIKNLKN